MGTQSSWTTIDRDVPQGSVLGPLVFNIFLNGLFYLPLNSSLVNYADDNHICHENENLQLLKDNIQNEAFTANSRQLRQISEYIIVMGLYF